MLPTITKTFFLKKQKNIVGRFLMPFTDVNMIPIL